MGTRSGDYPWPAAGSVDGGDVAGFPLARTLAVLGRSLHMRPTPSLAHGALSPALLARRPHDAHLPAAGTAVSRRGPPHRAPLPVPGPAAAAAVADFAASGVAVVDGVLGGDALAELRAFCEASTLFHKAYIQGYVGAFMGDGFGAAGLLHQVMAPAAESRRGASVRTLASGAACRDVGDGRSGF